MFSGMKLEKAPVQNSEQSESLVALYSGDPKSSCARGVEAFMHGMIFHLVVAKKSKLEAICWVFNGYRHSPIVLISNDAKAKWMKQSTAK